MRKIIRFCKYAKFIGLLGLPGIIWQLPLFHFFWLFWLFGVFEIVLDFSVFLQNMKMVIGILVVPLKYGRHLPNKANCCYMTEFSLPFAGEWVVVNGGVEKKLSHSWDIPTQRYAYDFLILDGNTTSYNGSRKNPDSYYCYGKEILAPADGVVVEILDGQPDSVISDKGLPDCSAKDIRGNYILIRHEVNLYSVLAHLKQGTLCVKVGDKVVRGERIALCGNSGNSSEPHLHFQVQDGKSFFFSAGLPIRFSNVKKAPFPDYENYDKRVISAEAAENEYIMRGQLVNNDFC